jgi:hypothetical protein
MRFFKLTPERRQTAWHCGYQGTIWYANIDAPVDDNSVIEDAKLIVDAARPQKHGPYGAHYYSFITREYLLNILLFHYSDHGVFPEGTLCIVDEWVWKNTTRVGNSHWFSWSSKKTGRHYERPFWIKIPKLSDVKFNSSSDTSLGGGRS